MLGIDTFIKIVTHREEKAAAFTNEIALQEHLINTLTG